MNTHRRHITTVSGILLLVLLLCGCSSSKSGEDPRQHDPTSGKQDTVVPQKPPVEFTGRADSLYKAMLKVNTYALGGVGVAGTTSYGEKLFDSLMSEKENEALMSALTINALPAGKCYGLLGLHRLQSPKELEALERLRASTDSTTTMRGCIMSREPVVRIVAEIQSSK